ncbi:alpha/beta fold hydrolase, partial [Ignavibacterium sp.]|uniref:alpha/beta fold hydrolase n=1 Tax=Ignavibacterium sp. TaxID=2651167 RepID=UPI00307EA3C0
SVLPLSGLTQGQMSSEEWYLPTTDRMARLYVLEFGKGDTIVVVHGGFGAEHSYLLGAVKPLADQFHIVMYDQRGSLRSPCPDSAISLQRHVDDLELLRNALRLQKMTIIAHSMGTFLAMKYLKQYPSEVKDLILLGSLPVFASSFDSTMHAIMLRAESLGNRPEVQSELRKAGLDKDSLSPKENTLAWRIRFASANLFHLDRWRSMPGGMVFYSARAGSATSQTMPRSWDFTDVFARHPFPITIINGDVDYCDPAGNTNRSLLANTTNVEVITIKNAAHCSWLDDPEGFQRALTQSLNKQRR